jgi:restriction system protein
MDLMQGFFLAIVLIVIFSFATSPWNAKRIATRIIDEHVETLARRRAQLVRIDDYGVEVDRAWQREINHFIDKVIVPKLRPSEQNIIQARRDEIAELINLKARSQKPLLSRQSRSAETSGIEFERECQEILTGRGWSARRTPASGDQGADILAEKDGLSVAIQCKFLARPVGNKAVQEVAAARTYYGVDAAAVVATGDYTEAARRLAARNDVLLLHVDDLGNLEDRLGEAAPRGRAPERG